MAGRLPIIAKALPSSSTSSAPTGTGSPAFGTIQAWYSLPACGLRPYALTRIQLVPPSDSPQVTAAHGPSFTLDWRMTVVRPALRAMVRSRCSSALRLRDDSYCCREALASR